jgi:hypothetical protein
MSANTLLQTSMYYMYFAGLKFPSCFCTIIFAASDLHQSMYPNSILYSRDRLRRLNPQGYVIGSSHINEPSHAAKLLLSVLSKLGVVIQLALLSGYSITIIAVELCLSHPVLRLVFSPGQFNVMVTEVASSCPVHFTIQI